MCINKTALRGKILLCDKKPIPDTLDYVFATVYKSSAPDVSFVEVVPSSGLSPKDYAVVQTYFNSSKYGYRISFFVLIGSILFE